MTGGSDDNLEGQMLLRHKEYGCHQFSESEVDTAKKEGWEPIEKPSPIPAPIPAPSKGVPEKPKGVDSPVR